MRYLVVDGMLSGTGVRDSVEGGYIVLERLGLSGGLKRRLTDWLARYEDAHCHGFHDPAAVKALDEEGVSLAVALRDALPEAKVEYYSSAHMRRLPLDR